MNFKNVLIKHLHNVLSIGYLITHIHFGVNSVAIEMDYSNTEDVNSSLQNIWVQVI